MCGIAGIFDRSGAPVDRRLLERMTTAVAHRGPDGEGYFIDQEIGLGHRRLSIIDIDGGAQPIANADGSLQIVFNGEIYNYLELREELVALGHRFKTRSDTEVIVHAYEQWGTAGVDRLNGMFAFAIWDTRRRTLLLARDHLGIKPLYYTTTGTQLLFASEIKSLMQHPHFVREVDMAALSELFTFRCVPAPKSLIAGVFKLQPGHLMTVTRREMRVRRFWNHVPNPDALAHEGERVERYRSLLESTVRMQLRSDVPLGLFLSSGVDSGVLLALMSEYSPTPVQAFTIDFAGGGRSNEAADAGRVARRYGATHHTLTVTADDYLAYFDRYMSDLEEPVGHEAAPAFYFVAKLAREHVKVALSGQGADEPWAGYHRYRGVKLSGLYSRLPPAVCAGIAGIVGRLPFPMERVKRGVVSLGERDVLTRFTKVYSFFSAEMKAELYKGTLRKMFDADPYASRSAISEAQNSVRHLDPLSQMLYLDTRTNLPDDLLMVGDKTSMANSLEVRVPFLDRRLVEFAEMLPPHLKLHGLRMTGKYLHKKALLKWLPHAEVYRRKKGFDNPLGHWLRTSMRALVDDCLLSPNTLISRYFDQHYIWKILELDRQGRENFTRQIYLLLSLELWHRAFMR
jgi:asparagine synthase (glutamine-hydrolysing)